MILIMVEPSYSNSIWCQNLVDGLVAELKLKRIAFRFISSVDELDDKCHFIYVIGSVSGWVRGVLESCDRAGIYPILLSNQTFHRFPIRYSAVCSDTANSIKHLVSTLRSMGRLRIALYGVNPNSIPDESRKTCFLAAQNGHGLEDIFVNDGSLEQCYLDFRNRSSDYDAVICANDFAAISLVRNLSRDDPEELERLSVIGCAETRLTEFYGKHILSIRVNFREYGRAAVTLLDTLRRNPYLSNIVMAIRWDFSPLNTLQAPVPHQPPSQLPQIPEVGDTFYADQELRDMLRLEQLLNECDNVDKAMIRYLVAGESYEVIADRCFVTVSTVKYRIRKMLSISQSSNRAALVALVREYMSEEDIRQLGT